jgi:hypothetical protein
MARDVFLKTGDWSCFSKALRPRGLLIACCSFGIVTSFRVCGRSGGSVAKAMQKISYDGYRLPPDIIQQAIWLYLRFTLSFRDVEDLLAERGITVSYETVQR